MSIKDMQYITVEHVNTLRQVAITIEQELAATKQKLEPLQTKLTMYESACKGLPDGWLEYGSSGCVKNVRDERDAYLAELEPLRREVTMLRKELILCEGAIANTSFWKLRKSVSAAIDGTQATAEAYEREIAAKALEKAANKYKSDYHYTGIDCTNGIVSWLTIEANELRAANK